MGTRDDGRSHLRKARELLEAAGLELHTAAASSAVLAGNNEGPDLPPADGAHRQVRGPWASRIRAHALGAPCDTMAKWLYQTIGEGAHARGQDQAAVQATLSATATDWCRNEQAVALRRESGRWSVAPSQHVMVDDASLADTRSFAAIVDQAGAVGAKVLLVGDHLQRLALPWRGPHRHDGASRVTLGHRTPERRAARFSSLPALRRRRRRALRRTPRGGGRADRRSWPGR